MIAANADAALLRGCVGGLALKAGFSTALRSGRNDSLIFLVELQKQNEQMQKQRQMRGFFAALRMTRIRGDRDSWGNDS
jgi:hypothetical protein